MTTTTKKKERGCANSNTSNHRDGGRKKESLTQQQQETAPASSKGAADDDCRLSPPPLVSNKLALPNLGTRPIKAVYLGYRDLVPTQGGFAKTIRDAVDAGYNLLVLAFWVDPVTGVDPFSAADHWSRLSKEEQSTLLEYLHGVNARIIVSLGGSTFKAYQASGPFSGTNYGTRAAHWARGQGLDGVDFDLENIVGPGFTTESGMTKTQLIQWMTDATVAARTILGIDALITHAPQSPYFQTQEFAQGYLDFWLQTPRPPVDLFLIQYYNQGDTYKDYTTQILNDDNVHPGTAVAQLIDRGLPKELIVVGKLTQARDGDSVTWVPPEEIHTWVARALNDPDARHWSTGVSTWEWNTSGNPTSAFFIDTVYP